MCNLTRSNPRQSIGLKLISVHRTVQQDRLSLGRDISKIVLRNSNVYIISRAGMYGTPLTRWRAHDDHFDGYYAQVWRPENNLKP